MDYSILISAFALLVSIINLLLYYRHTGKTALAAIKHVLENLPPYRDEDEMTKITLVNVGSAKAKLNMSFLEFSWDEDLQLILFYEEEVEPAEFLLPPKGEKVFYKRLPKPPLDKSVAITITTLYNNGWSKEDTVLLKVPKGSFESVGSAKPPKH